MLLVVGVLIATGWRQGASPEIEAASTSLALPVTTSLPPTTSSTTVAPAPDVASVSPTFTASFVGDGAEMLGGTLVALIGQGDPILLLLTFGGEGGESVIHGMPRNTYGPVRFDLSRTQYAFIDSAFRLHIRPTRVARDDVNSSEAIRTNVRSFAWSLDDAERIAWVTFDQGGPLLVETDHFRTVGSPGDYPEVGFLGDADLVGFDATGFYVFDGDMGTVGGVLRKLDIEGNPVAEIQADIAYVGAGNLVVVGRFDISQGDTGALDVVWYLSGENFSTLDPIPGPRSFFVGITASSAEPRRVAFLSVVVDPNPVHVVTIYDITDGTIREFALDFNAWDIQWSDDDRFIVVSGTEQAGRGYLVQLLAIDDTGFITTLAFDGRIRSAQLISQPNPLPTAGGFDEATGCQPTIPPQPGFKVPGDREVTPPHVWYGTPDLWTVLEEDGSYLERMSVWWSTNFPGGWAEESPDISVVAQRLDADVPDITSQALGTNAYTPADGWFMLADFPADFPFELPAGCWEVIGAYKGASLSYVVEAP